MSQERNTISNSAHPNASLAQISEPINEPVDRASPANGGLASAQSALGGHRRKMSIPRKQVSNPALRQQDIPIRDQPGTRALDAVPPVPTAQSATLAATDSLGPRTGEIRQGRQQIYDRPYLVEGASQAPSLEGIVNLTNTVDTTTHIRYAPGK